MPALKPHLNSLKPYQPGESKIAGVKTPVKLSSNENPLGCSPKARAAFARSASRLHLYPDAGAGSLVKALSDQHKIQSDCIICGAGSDELISLIAAAYTGAGDEAIISRYGFLSHYLAVVKAGATPVITEENHYKVDLQAMRASVTDKTRLVYIANPNNPTGSFLSMDDIKAFHKELNPDILLVIDAAYAEYIEGYDGGLQLARNASNIIMLRTFSKIYGLAGLRLGWAYAPAEIIHDLNKIRLPFNVNLPAQNAACAALQDQEFIRYSAEFNKTWRDWLFKTLHQSGYQLVQGYGNFLLIHFPEETGKTAQKAYQYLAQNGIILRPVSGYGLPHSLRLSIGEEEDNKRVADLLDTFLNSSLA